MKVLIVFIVVFVGFCAFNESLRTSSSPGTSSSTSASSSGGRIQVGMTEEQVIPLCDNSYQRRAGNYAMTAVCKIGFGSGYYIIYDQSPMPGRRVVAVDLCALERNKGMCD